MVLTRPLLPANLNSLALELWLLVIARIVVCSVVVVLVALRVALV